MDALSVTWTDSPQTFLWWGDSQFQNGNMMAAFPSAREARSGRRALIANAAVSGTRTAQWLPSTDVASLYQVALAAFRSWMAQVAFAPVVALMCSLGTNDALFANVPWAANMSATLNAFRADLGIAAPLYFSRNPPLAGNGQPFWDQVLAEQLLFAGGTGVSTPNEVRPDKIHFDLQTVNDVIVPGYLSVLP